MARNQRLLDELNAAWKDLDAILESQKDSFPVPGPWRWEYAKIESLRALFEEAAETLLSEPLRRYRKARPQQRVLAALEDHEAALAAIIRQLPGSMEVAGRDLAATLRPEAHARFRGTLRRLQRRPRPVPLRLIAERHFQAQRLDWAEATGTLLLVLAQASLAVLDPWEALSEEALNCIEGGRPNPESLPRTKDRWLKLVAKLRQRAGRALDFLNGHIKASPAVFAKALLRSPRSPRRPSRFRQTDRLLEYNSYWSRQRVAVSELVELDVKLVEVGRQAVRAAESTLESLLTEHTDLLGELDLVAGWLEGQKEGNDSPFPPPKAILITAEDRGRDWRRSVAQGASLKLPSTLETTNPRSALPGWRAPWKEISPLRLFLDNLEGAGHEAALEGLREAEAIHRAIVREIERSREVVTYSIEAAEAEGESEVAREGIANALSLILYQKQAVGDVCPAAERGLIEGSALVFSRCYVAVDQGRLGVLTHFARQGGYRSARKAVQAGTVYLRRFLIWLWGKLKAFYRWGLISIGWEREPERRQEPVRRRGYLGESLHFEHEPRDLPMIYKRLFRLQPVEDPRFLVGRDREMAALADARAQWESGRAVSVLIAGERGSGKTSLLNCAMVRTFHDMEIVQGRFSDRLQCPEQVEALLRGMLVIPAEEDFCTALTKKRRIIVLEETERTYLRHVNGFGGLRHLLSLISNTSRSTLWVLSLNLVAFKYLSASVGLNQYFSHQINAMSVEPEHLKNAILLRHNLSGLRLSFAAPPGKSRIAERARQILGLEENREQLFFDALYRESEGVFRSAFELWRRHIDRAEGGMLYLRHPMEPDYELLASRLSRHDLFTLQAILQHGSLTPPEHALVFGLTEKQSRNAMEGLADREILEPDPQAVGWRVRPEAGHFVRRTLDRENLL